jgi:hypothetical protein
VCFGAIAAGTSDLVAIRAGIAVLAHFFLGALAGQGLLHTKLFPRLQVEGVPLDFLDDIFRLHLTFKPAQRVLQRLAFLYTNFCQSIPPSTAFNSAHIILAYFGQNVGPSGLQRRPKVAILQVFPRKRPGTG